MQRCAFTPYEGQKPYIFVSYAHKDSDQVFPVLEELDRQGYRVWYDDGIAPGSEWPENIAQHLDGCSLTLAFISPNSIASANCRREVTFALSKRKPFLGIVLKPTEMSLGMEMQLSAQQCIMKYTYRQEDAFFQKVCSCPDLKPCLGQPKVVPVAAPPVAAAAPVAAPAPVPRPKKEKKPLDKKQIAILGGIAAAVVAVVLVIVLIVALGGNGDQNLESGRNDTAGIETPADTGPQDSRPDDATDQTELVFKDQVITAEDVAYMSRQSQLVSLRMENCTIETGALETLQLAATVSSVEMVNCTGVTNLHSLAALENLTNLVLTNCGIGDETLSKLSSKVLEAVDISGNPAFTDLGIFADCSGIRQIDFSNTGVASVEALAGAAQLEVVSGSNTQVKDLTVLANMTDLKELYFANCGIETIATPFYSLALSKLDLSGNLLKDTEFLTYCTRLSVVDLSYNLLEDAEMLSKNAGTLDTLHLGGNPELYYFDLEWLNQCTELRWLNLDGIYLVNLDMISNLTALEYLSAVDCTVMDIAGLQGCYELNYLNLAFNRIKDISVLSLVAGDGMILDLSFNDLLEDVLALPRVSYQFLNLTNSYLDLMTLPQLYGGTLVLLYDAGLTDMELLEFESFVVIGAPLDKVMTLQDHFGEERLSVLQEDFEYLQMLQECGVECGYIARSFAEAE